MTFLLNMGVSIDHHPEQSVGCIKEKFKTKCLIGWDDQPM